MEDRHLTISITSWTVIKIILFLLLVGFLYVMRSIVLDVLTAIVIASAIEPGIKALRRRKVPRTLAVIILYITLFFVFFVIFYFFLPSLFGDIANFIAALPGYLEAFNRTGALDQYANLLGLQSPSTVPAQTIIDNIHNALNLNLFDNGFDTASRIFGGIFSFVIIVVFSFYFAVLETGVDDFLRIIVPKSHQEYILGLWKRSQHKIGKWMQGQLLLAVIMGVLVFLGLTVLGVPDALVLATIAGCFEIIPVFGPTLSAVPAVALAFGSGGATLGILTIALFIIAQQFENYLIYPLVVTRVVGVPPLLVILALIIGGEFAGFLGIILSVPLAATIQEFARDIEQGRLPSRYKADSV
jgi:predicted PurR-regulated permease PerM